MQGISEMFCNSSHSPIINTNNHMVSSNWLTNVYELEEVYFNIHENFTDVEEDTVDLYENFPEEETEGFPPWYE